MPFLLLVVSLVCTAAGPYPPKSPTTKTPVELTLDEKVPTWLRAFSGSSVAIAYIDDGKVAWTAFYGDQTQGGPPADGKTLYNLASLTKPITAETVLRLASAGKLTLDEPVSAYWTDPDLKGNPWSDLLTPRLCLSHQTGFPNWRYQTDNILKFQWKPGTQTGYSGEGYEYVARFMEKKLGRSLEDLAKQFVFEPIGMGHTSYTPQDWWAGHQADPVESKSRVQANAADLLRSTVGDYAKFVLSVMHGDGVSQEIAGQRLTITRNMESPEAEAVACEAAKDPSHCKVTLGNGLGWRIVKINGETIVDHTGSDWDVKTIAFFLPKRRSGAVIFANGSSVNFRLITKLVSVLYPDQVYIETLL